MHTEKYKESPLGVIPKDWKVRRLGEVYKQISGFSFSREVMTSSPQKIAYIHYGDIHKLNNKDFIDLRNDTLPYLCNGVIASDKLDKIDFPYLLNGDLILADASEDKDGVGKAIEVIDCNELKVVAGLHTVALRKVSDKDIAIGYSRYIFRNTNAGNWLKRISQGTKVYSISYNLIKKLHILLPPLAEQERIAEALGMWDVAIEKQGTLVDALTRRKHAIMQQLLTARKRLPDFSAPWLEVKLGEIFSERNETRRIELPLLSITADQGVILQSESDKKDTSNDDKSKYKRICCDDIGYNTMRMWQGRSALSQIEGIVSPAYTIVTPRDSAYSIYFRYLFKMPRMTYKFWTHSQGLVNDTLNCKYHDFATVNVKIPPLEEQKAISQILTTADQGIESAKSKLEALRTQKRGLMQQLLTGKKRLNM